MVAEGVRATRMFLARAPKLDLETPFIGALGELLDGQITPGDAVKRMVENQ